MMANTAQVIGSIDVASAVALADAASGMAKRKTIREAGIAPVQLDLAANEMLQDWCDKSGRIKRDVLSKLVRWWLAQPLFFRQYTLGEVGTELVEAYADALEEMADALRGIEITLPTPPAAQDGNQASSQHEKPPSHKPKADGKAKRPG